MQARLIFLDWRQSPLPTSPIPISDLSVLRSDIMSHQHVQSNWRGFVIDRNKKRGPVGHREHVAFLMLWLEHLSLMFLFS
jgi:hypothetical protein